MDKIFNASYSFSLGDINFQVDVDETLSLEKRKKEYTESDDKDFHDHPFYEIFFVFDDEMKITFEKETNKYRECVVCLPPNVKHYSVRATDYRILFLYNRKNASKGNFENFISNVLATDSICKIPNISPDIAFYMTELSKVFYSQKQELDREVIVSLLKCIFYSLYLLYEDREPAKQNDYYLNESRYIIISSLVKASATKGNDITLTTVADALCLSKKQASRLIFKYYGKALSEVVTEEKLNYAAYLLKNTELSAYDIAFESNFHSYSYFCRRFTEKFGCVPLSYRKNPSSTT